MKNLMSKDQLTVHLEKERIGISGMKHPHAFISWVMGACIVPIAVACLMLIAQMQYG